MADKALYSQGRYIRYLNNGTSIPVDSTIKSAVFSPSGQSVGNFKTPTPWSYVSTRNKGLSGNITDATSTVPTAEVLVSGDFPVHAATFNSAPDLETAAYNVAVSKLGDLARESVDWTVTAFQGKQTSSMIKSGLKVLDYAADFYRKFRHNPVKAIGEKWLEYQYGWKPLVSDCYNTFESLMKATQDGNIRVIGRGTQTADWQDVIDFTSIDGYNLPIRRVAHYSHSVRLVAWLKPPDNMLQSVSNYSSLNPLSIAWELVPFSFVVDWVFDVGGYLRAAETALTHSNRFVRGYRNDLKVFDSKISNTGSPSNRPKRMYYLTGGGGQKVIFQRRLLSSFPCQKFPSFSFNLGSGRLLNAAALLSTTLGKR